MNLPASVDRVEERNRFDRFGFLSFAVAGAIGIVVMKWLGVPATLAALAAVTAMAVYAFLEWRGGARRMRADQAGDNCYYLGLIYTLASLAYAIFTFDPADTATTIVQGFGIALATTILGLILRVFFIQSRTDIVEMEENARVELVNASSALKASLGQLTEDMNGFGRGFRQSLEEASHAHAQWTAAITATVAKTMDDAAAAMSGAVERHVAGLAGSADRISAAAGEIAKGLSAQAVQTTAFADAAGRAATQLGAVDQLATAARTALDVTTTQAAASADLQRAAKADLDKLAGTLAEQSRMMMDLAKALNAHQREMTERLEAMRTAPAAQVEAALETLGHAAERVAAQTERAVGAQRAVLDDLTTRAEAAARLAAEHSRALESDLAASRANVGKVHGALVQMTGQLVTQVERRG